MCNQTRTDLARPADFGQQQQAGFSGNDDLLQLPDLGSIVVPANQIQFTTQQQYPQQPTTSNPCLLSSLPLDPATDADVGTVLYRNAVTSQSPCVEDFPGV